jgi:hypothetical protein
VPRVRVPSAEDETRASQPVIVEPTRVLAVPSLARAERAKSSGTTSRADTPLMRFRPLQRTRASDALPDAATHRTIPLRRFARRAVPLPRCGACGSVVCCSARRSRDGIAHACMASSLRFFADASSSTHAGVDGVPRSNGRARRSTALVRSLARRRALHGTRAPVANSAGRRVMRRQDFRRMATFRYPLDLPEPCLRASCLENPKAFVTRRARRRSWGLYPSQS